MIEIILVNFVVALVSFWVGWKYREYYAKRVVQEYQHNLKKALDFIDSHTVVVTIIKDGEYFLVYNKETKEFLAQGKSHQEIVSILRKRFPDKAFNAERGNIDSVGYDYDSF